MPLTWEEHTRAPTVLPSLTERNRYVRKTPTAEWIANQLTQAYGWERTPRYLIRDRNSCYGGVLTRRLRSLGIRDHPTSPRSPWQNGHAERLIGSIRRECLEHVGERHLRHVLSCYMEYYNAARAHLSLGKDAPIRRAKLTKDVSPWLRSTATERRERGAAHRVLIELSLDDPCTALCVIDRAPKPRAADGKLSEVS